MFRNSLFKNASAHFNLKRVSQTQAKATQRKITDTEASAIVHTMLVGTGIISWGLYSLYQDSSKSLAPSNNDNRSTFNVSYKK